MKVSKVEVIKSSQFHSTRIKLCTLHNFRNQPNEIKGALNFFSAIKMKSYLPEKVKFTKESASELYKASARRRNRSRMKKGSFCLGEIFFAFMTGAATRCKSKVWEKNICKGAESRRDQLQQGMRKKQKKYVMQTFRSNVLAPNPLKATV